MKPGDRVAVVSADGKKFKGYGVYVGDEDCEKLRLYLAEQARGMGQAEIADRWASGEKKLPNPKMQLDDGTEAWGCECWWGPAADFVENGWAAKLGVEPAPEVGA